MEIRNNRQMKTAWQLQDDYPFEKWTTQNILPLKNYKLQITNYIKVGRGISGQVLGG